MTEIVSKRIEESIQDKSIHLDLSNCGIENIQLSNLTHVKKLDLSNNKISNICNLPPFLDELNLSNNGLYALVEDCIPESVTVLDLSNNVIRRIKSIPPNILDLNISYNLIYVKVVHHVGRR